MTSPICRIGSKQKNKEIAVAVPGIDELNDRELLLTSGT
jgi:hypothetical protein